MKAYFYDFVISNLNIDTRFELRTPPPREAKLRAGKSFKFSLRIYLQSSLLFPSTTLKQNPFLSIF